MIELKYEEKRLDEVVKIIRGITFASNEKSKEWFEGAVACLRTTNVQQEVEWDDLWFVKEGHVKRDEQYIRHFDILISNANSYELVGKVALVTEVKQKATLGTFITLFRANEGVNPCFVYYQLASSNIQQSIREKASTTTNISNVSTTKLASVMLRLPPLADQERIVAEIERQFTRLNAGTEALRRVERNLKRYRAAVLKAACEGKLVPTEAELAKTEKRDYETGKQLLTRILKERQSQWAGRGQYKAPAAPNTDELASLPKGWAWATVEQLADVTGGLTKGKHHKDKTVLRDVPYLRVANVQRGYLDLNEIKTIVATEEDIQKLTLKRNDILFNEGGDRDKLGRGWIWEDQISGCIHQNHVFRARLYFDEVQSKFISFHGNSFGQQWFMKTGKQSVNLASINLTVLKNFPIPLPPLAEQARIVDEVERRLSLVDEVEQIVKTNLARAANLKQAILKRAFEG